MKNQFSVLIALALIMQSCGSKTGDSIADNFGGDVNYFEDMLRSDEQAEELFTHMTRVKNSNMLDTLNQGYACATIAIMAYEGLTSEQKNKFQQLYVEIENKEKDPTVYYYKMPVIESCAHQAKIFTEFSEDLLDGKYKVIAKRIIPKYRTPTLGQELENFVRPLLEQHGKIENYKRTEFRIASTMSGKSLYKYDGVLTFEDGYKRPYYITVSTNVQDNQIHGYQLDI